MTRLRLALPLLLVVLLAGCVLPIPVPEGTPGALEVVIDEGDSCGARDLRGFVGQDRSVVEGTTILDAGGAPVPLRILGPGDPVTEDFNPRRVNVRADASRRIVGVDCG